MGLRTQIKKLWRHPSLQPSLSTEPSADQVAAQFPDIPRDQIETYVAVKPYTMTSPERTFGLCQAVEHVVRHRIPGALVECGVWRGGSALAMLRVLRRLEVEDRQLWLYDTFEGMSPPGREDIDCFGNSAEQLLERDQAKRQAADSVWCEASLGDVQQNLVSVPYPRTYLHFIQGKVEQTLPQQAPAEIALLRLDTDWFESTWHELIHLYPRLQPGGVLIIDDYGHWQGCRQAVDQFIAQRAPNLFLHRLDYTGRLAIKPHA